MPTTTSGFAGLNLQRPAFQPLLFVPAAQQNEMMGQVVRWVDAACHERLPQGGNHWSLYLNIGEDRSVRIDITPSYVVPSASIPGGTKANMVVSLLEDAFSRPTEKAVKLDVPDGSTVRELVNLLIQHGRHKYEFNGQGQGCRYWTDHQIDLFYQHGLLVDCAQIEAAKEAILTQWPDQMRYPCTKQTSCYTAID